MKQKPKLLSGGLTHRFIRGYTVSMKRNRKPPLEVVEDVIMFATPFGDYMGNVINNIGQSLTQTQDKANYDNAESEMEDLFQKDKNSSGIGISN